MWKRKCCSRGDRRGLLSRRMLVLSLSSRRQRGRIREILSRERRERRDEICYRETGDDRSPYLGLSPPKLLDEPWVCGTGAFSARSFALHSLTCRSENPRRFRRRSLTESPKGGRPTGHRPRTGGAECCDPILVTCGFLTHGW